METIVRLLNNETIANAFFNLKMRWADEKDYEDIKDYGTVIVNAICSCGFDIDKRTAKMTKSPFGLKATIDGTKWHIFVKSSGRMWSVAAKKAV